MISKIVPGVDVHEVKPWFLSKCLLRINGVCIKCVHYDAPYRFYRSWAGNTIVAEGQRKWSTHLRAIVKALERPTP